MNLCCTQPEEIERERKKEREEVMYINSTGEQQFIPPTKTTFPAESIVA
jgi:hypothetical protein